MARLFAQMSGLGNPGETAWPWRAVDGVASGVPAAAGLVRRGQIDLAAAPSIPMLILNFASQAGVKRRLT
jgi:hypothetical protein